MSLSYKLAERLKNGRATVLGIGISNLPLIYWLVSHGVKVTARDMKPREKLPSADDLEAKGVELILGDSYLCGIDEDVIFRAPGIRPDIPEIADAVRKGAVLTSEMELFFEITPAKLFAVTGSDGKTTTTTLSYKLLDAEMKKNGSHGRVYVGGNIGTPLLPMVDEMTKDDICVLELSSFQLQTMRRSPERAVITNVTPNHLNWHTGMDEYIDAKKNICRYGASALTVNAENDITSAIGADFNGKVTFFSSKNDNYAEITVGKSSAFAIFERDGMIIRSDGNTEEVIIKTEDIIIPGRHNVENYMAAISLTHGLVSHETIEHIAKTFGGVEHRLELVRTHCGVKYYNSSIDSSPTRTAAALSALRENPIVICGGYDKNIPFAPLASALCKRAKAVILTGATAEKIHLALLECPDFNPEKLPVLIERDFDTAVFAARDMASSGDTVLLSPACASFDSFVNFEARGRHFKDLVNGF